MAALVPELSVSQFATSRHFYCEVLGFSVRYTRPDEGFAFLELGAAQLMLDQLGAGRDWVTAALERPFGRGVNLQIEVEAIDPIYQRIVSAGIEPYEPVETKSYQAGETIITQRQFCVQDPDGYLLRFFETV
jgi:catechol 2,3-dioxygenase-like lactoylglutathione lyase family enzyme